MEKTDKWPKHFVNNLWQTFWQNWIGWCSKDHKAKSSQFSYGEIILIKDEIDRLLTKSIIKETCHEEQKFVPSIFISPKSNDEIRLILSLKQLNKNSENHHFKMESINKILNLITKDCFMASLVLKDAYYSVKISEILKTWVPW